MMVTMLSKQELDRKRQEQQQEHDREQGGHDRELDREREDKREKARARERAEDLERQERDRAQRDYDRQLDRERAAEHDRLLIENSAGLQQLRRDMANSPRFSRRGTPTGTPVPAVDDRPKPAPRKTPTKVYHTVPYQAADRHPGSAETTPSHHVPVVTCRLYTPLYCRIGGRVRRQRYTWSTLAAGSLYQAAGNRAYHGVIAIGHW